jgi:D-glycero-D-manno-heptose 1,7-bisphosphate phosphatase
VAETADMVAPSGEVSARRAVFFDRDGTLNVNFGYVHRRQEWEWITGAIDALKSLHEAGFALVIVTNQAGIARGYYEPEDVEALHDWMTSELAVHGVELTGIYYCPHHPDFGEIKQCACRKPEPGMLLRAAQELDIDLRNSWIIGDQLTDGLAGLSAGTKALVIGNQSAQDIHYFLKTQLIPMLGCSERLFVEPSITAAVKRILAD